MGVVEPFLRAWQMKKMLLWAPVYLRGLLLPGERKSIEPLASRVAPGHDQEVRHFVSESPWDAEPVELVLWQNADRMLGGEQAVLIIDDTEQGFIASPGETRLLRDLLASASVDSTGWELKAPLRISDDGKVVFGSALCGGVPAVYRWVLPE
jgi:hypothetical protein